VLQEGKIIRWQDERGFGFIRLSDGGEVFLHISALGQIERRPQLGDEVIFEIEEESNGRRRAANAVIKGVLSLTPTQRPSPSARIIRQTPHKAHPRTGNRSRPLSSWVRRRFPFLLFLIGVSVYGSISPRVQAWLHPFVPPSDSSPNEKSPAPRAGTNESFTCSGKTHCSQMNSCEEAIYYLNHCPFPKMDGDGDGIPCEQQWCRY
jgi:cold shock CspA family protein